MRAPQEVMRLDRIGSFHQTRLSFMRSLLRLLKQQEWTFSRPIWNIDTNGGGRAVYIIATAEGRVLQETVLPQIAGIQSNIKNRLSESDWQQLARLLAEISGSTISTDDKKAVNQ